MTACISYVYACCAEVFALLNKCSSFDTFFLHFFSICCSSKIQSEWALCIPIVCHGRFHWCTRAFVSPMTICRFFHPSIDQQYYKFSIELCKSAELQHRRVSAVGMACLICAVTARHMSNIIILKLITKKKMLQGTKRWELYYASEGENPYVGSLHLYQWFRTRCSVQSKKQANINAICKTIAKLPLHTLEGEMNMNRHYNGQFHCCGSVVT